MSNVIEELNIEVRTRRKKPYNKGAKIVIDPKLCKSCALCVFVCPTGVLEMVENKRNIYNYSAEAIAPEYCTLCQFCVYQCPDFAITIEEEKGGEK
ncbi:MAG: 4Fe-4S dicluster domain-containing protein [Candidatus Aminicenantes bacterium]|nr:4Fe-4S dicluster domain-containing protein [Candidatus Aminicenantes bacterium]